MVVGVERRPGESADAVGRLAGPARRLGAERIRRRDRGGNRLGVASELGRQRRLSPAHHLRIEPGRLHRIGPRRACRARPADSGRSTRMVPSGETFSRPSSVRRITSGVDADAVRRRQDAPRPRRDCPTSSMNCAARPCARTSRRSTSGLSSAHGCAHRQHLLGGALRESPRRNAGCGRCRDRPRPNSTARRRRRHPHARWRGSRPCRAAAAPPAARPRRDRRRPRPSRTAADSCGSRTGNVMPNVSGSSPRFLRSRDHARAAPAPTPSGRRCRRRGFCQIAACKRRRNGDGVAVQAEPERRRRSAP